jgi:hypothetical protein
MALSVYDNQYHPVDYYTDRLWPILYWPTVGGAPVIPPNETWVLDLTPATIVGAALVEDGMFGAYLQSEEWPLFVSLLPSDPCNAAAIFDTTPMVERSVYPAPRRRSYGIQLLVRSRDALEGRERMNDAFDDFATFQNRNVQINSNWYRIKQLQAITGIIHLGVIPGDPRRCHLYSLNMRGVIMGLET